MYTITFDWSLLKIIKFLLAYAGSHFVQAVCTVVSILACVPLGELFFFHLILIRKVSDQETGYYFQFSGAIADCF